MKKLQYFLTISVFLLLASCRLVDFAEFSVTGVVTDKTTGVTLSGVAVELNPGGVQVTTDVEGRFSIGKLSLGEYSLVFSKTDYTEERLTVSLARNYTETVAVLMQSLQGPGPDPSSDPLEALEKSMVFVEGGSFQMGATSEQGSEAEDDEQPIHSVTLSDFTIGKYEVTQAQWEAVMGSNPSHQQGDDLPVENVSWEDVQEFIAKLNEVTGKTYRLPTEAEWEYAARGGNKSQGYKYAGSDEIEEVAWYYDNSGDATHPVGQKQSNELGLYDMSGNVWEWCHDWYGDYSSGSQANPTGPASGTYRILRGGSWDDSAWFCRVSNRTYFSHSSRSYDFGFRLVLGELPPPEEPEEDPLEALEKSMVFVEGGTFQMGATEEQESEAEDEQPVHSVTLSDFTIGKYEVTQAQWEAVMGSNPSHQQGDDLPVENVSWEEIQIFIEKLNEMTGKTYRLPTEAEWEYAARGGNKSQGYKYAGSNAIDEVAWYDGNSGDATHPVGQKQPNELDLYDMSGNVKEWCHDWYGAYRSRSQTDPTGPSSGSSRVLRGGCWNDDVSSCRVSSRYNINPARRYINYGFRLVLGELPPPEDPLEALENSMVFVEGGTFQMGAQGADALDDEQPVHSVTLSDFTIGRDEVTQAQWEAVMGSNPSKYKGDNLPVECVSWEDVQEFIAKLNEMTGKTYRLPTEAEWEYAARGGNKSQGYKYAGSNEIDEVAWYVGNSSYKPHPVGQKQPNELGLYDMSGNVWEWCHDWYGAYSYGYQTNPTGPASGMERIVRGGGGAHSAGDCRISRRVTRPPSNKVNFLGFRLVLGELPPQEDPLEALENSMVFVEGGTFQMGATEEQGADAYVDEKPVHSVTLSDFTIGKYEVTQAQWKAVMGSNPSEYKGDNLPIHNVSWDDVQEFIGKLNEKTGMTYRLPTEAEWEYAARGGNKSQGYKYSGSNKIEEVAWYVSNIGYRCYSVGQKKPNELGLYDMSGNVKEWCRDRYGAYSSDSQTNPTGPASGSSRVLRGGSYYDDARDCRVSIRNGSGPSDGYGNFGFRLVLVP